MATERPLSRVSRAVSAAIGTVESVCRTPRRRAQLATRYRQLDIEHGGQPWGAMTPRRSRFEHDLLRRSQRGLPVSAPEANYLNHVDDELF